MAWGREWVCTVCGVHNPETASRCEYCGAPFGGVWFKNTEGGDKKEGGLMDKIMGALPKGKGSPNATKATITLVAVLVALLGPWMGQTQEFLLMLFGGIPLVADTFYSVYVVVALLTALGLTYLSYEYSSIAPAIGIAIAVAIVVIVMFFAMPYFESSTGKAALYTFTCTFSNFGRPVNEWQDCTRTPAEITGEPDLEKIGSHTVLNVNFDTDYSGVVYKVPDENSLPTLNLKTFFLNLVVENPSETKTIYGFKIITDDDTFPTVSPLEVDTSLVRSGSVKGIHRIKLANLHVVNGDCEDSACNIEPREKRRLVLGGTLIIGCEGLLKYDCEYRDLCKWVEESESCVYGGDYMTYQVDAYVKYQYDYNGEGQYDFLIANSDSSMEALLSVRSNPTCSEGPVDVKPYFAPSAYLFRESDTSETNPKMYLMIKLENSGDMSSTKAILKKIVIKNFNSYMLISPSSCTAPWGDEVVLSSGSLGLGAEWSLRRSQTYTCEYGIDRYYSISEDGESVRFIVSTDYSYNALVSLSAIPVVELNT